MPFAYTVSAAEEAAKKQQLSAAVVTEIIGDASKSASHADAHMKSEDFWTTQRSGKDGTKIGSTATVDDHLKSEYKKRAEHSMFDSPLSAVEAITGALNTDIGAQALNSLMGQDDGIDLYSRTAVATLGGTQQFTRANPTKKAADPASMNKGDTEYVVVCLRKTNNYLMFASAYPVTSTDTTKLNNPGKDWYQKQSDKSVIKTADKVSPPVVPW